MLSKYEFKRLFKIVVNSLLVSLFLNDLVEFISHAYDGLTNVYNATHIFLDTEDISVYLKL
jgi:hypothetical protein